MQKTNSIYFDHQASTPILTEVINAMQPYWREQYGNPHSTEHSFGWAANKAVEKARRQLGALIGSDSDEIIFTSGATEANNIAMKALCAPRAARLGRNRLLVSAIEHKCVLESARYVSESLNYQLSVIPVDNFGKIDTSALVKLLDDDVQLVSIGLVNNEIGSIQKLAEISELCASHGAYLHSDCAQAPNAVDISNLSNIADALSFSGHKFGGPMGIGALYIKRSLAQNIETIIHGGGQELGIRSGTLPLPLCVGLGVASEIVGRPEAVAIRSEVANLRNQFVSIIQSARSEIQLNGDLLKNRHPGNANLYFPECDAQDVLLRLQPRIAASSGSACTSGVTEPSHVLQSIGLAADQANSSIRFSFGPENTMAEVELAAAILIETLTSILE